MHCENRNSANKRLRDSMASTFKGQHGLITRQQLLDLGSRRRV
jgi:hypothetical protein